MSDKLQVLVTGAGRGGTNLGIELVRSLGVPTTKNVEDRTFFKKALPANYATKLATENKVYISSTDLQNENKSRSKIVFVTRHPFDNILSKIRRGAPKASEAIMAAGYDT